MRKFETKRKMLPKMFNFRGPMGKIRNILWLAIIGVQEAKAPDGRGIFNIFI